MIVTLALILSVRSAAAFVGPQARRCVRSNLVDPRSLHYCLNVGFFANSSFLSSPVISLTLTLSTAFNKHLLVQCRLVRNIFASLAHF